MLNFAPWTAAPVASLLAQLFDRKVALRAMQAMQFDTQRLPLGSIAPTTIDQAFELLSALEVALSSSIVSKATLTALTARFYTLVPHVFPMNAPPPLLATSELVKEKIVMIESMRELVALQAFLTAPLNRASEASSNVSARALQRNKPPPPKKKTQRRRVCRASTSSTTSCAAN